MKCVVFGGEPTDPKVVEQVLSTLKLPPDALLNMYGMAECGLLVTVGHATEHNG